MKGEDALFLEAGATAVMTSAVTLPSSDAWATEVLQGCATVHCTPHLELLKVLAPPTGLSSQETVAVGSVDASSLAAGKAIDIIDVDADDGIETAVPPTLFASQKGEGTYQPYLPAPKRMDVSAEREALLSVIPSSLLYKAYRLQTPCMTTHVGKNGRLFNCVASPRCMAGLRQLGSDVAVREDYLRVMMGDGPCVIPLPTVQSTSTTVAIGSNAPVDPVSSSFSTAAATREATVGSAKSTLGAANAEVRGLADSSVTVERTVQADDSFPCLWRGVCNLANTCYFSSVLQLLFSVAPVRRAILVDGDAATVMTSLPHAAHDDPSKGSSASRVAESGLRELFTLMAFSRAGGGADPSSFASYLSLDVTVQQDAQEFLTLLLDWLRCHCGPAMQTAITSAFSGTLLYDRRCGACGRSVKRAEPFLHLSLPLRPTLEDALSEFSKPESVEGFMCEQCGETAVATSRQYMRTLPDVLVIHWNRFEFDLNTLQRHKVTTATSFPTSLDMTTYVQQWHEHQRGHTSGTPSSGEQARASGKRASGAEAAELYELRGVLNHLGDTAVSGHYTYHGNVSEQGTTDASPQACAWLNFNDADVSRLNRYQGQRGVSTDAYLLVYHRVDASATHPSLLASADATNPSHLGVTGDHAAPSVAKMVRTFASPSPAEYPAYLRHYVDRVNAECLEKRREWVQKRAEVAALFDAWATTAKAVFDGVAAAPELSSASAVAGATPDVPSSTSPLYVLPTHWLQQFGRFFLPAFVDAAALGANAESQLKHNRRDPTAAIGTEGATSDTVAGVSVDRGIASAGAEDKEASAKCEDDGTVEGTVVSTAATGPLRYGQLESVQELYQQIRQHALLQALPSLTCSHGCVSPWASFKVISANVYAKLASFLDSCGAPLRAAERTAEFAAAQPHSGDRVSKKTEFRDSVVASATRPSPRSPCALTLSNMCPLCAAAMAAAVQSLAVRAAEDEAAEKLLTEAWQEAGHGGDAGREEKGRGGDVRSNTEAAVPGAPHTHTSESSADEQEPQRVLVSEKVVEAWASFYVSQLRWKRVRYAEGYTGVLVMLEARVSAPPSSTGNAAPPAATGTLSTSLAGAKDLASLTTLNVDRGELHLSARFLCPHGVLRPSQQVLAVPAPLRHYWLHRFAELLTFAHRTGTLRSSNPHWSVNEADVAHWLLPLLPATSSSIACKKCMQSNVQQLTSIHQQRLRKMEEQKRYPTLWLAGAMTSPAGVAQLQLATGLETEEQLLASQHPNRLYFKQQGDKEYREYAKKWTEMHQQRIVHQTAEVQRLQTTLEKKMQRDAAWNARVTTRRGAGGRMRGSPVSPNPPAPPTPPAPFTPPDPQTLEGRLYYAQDMLEKLTAQTLPDLTVPYGCVPTWWVARWYAALQEEDAALVRRPASTTEDIDASPLSMLPRISFDHLTCAHGRCLLEIPWLNPSDGFWHGARAKRAEQLWKDLAEHRANAGPKPLEGPTASEWRSECWLPPLTIVPMEEYLQLLAQYGSSDMLQKAATSTTVSVAASGTEGSTEVSTGASMMSPPVSSMIDGGGAVAKGTSTGDANGDSKPTAALLAVPVARTQVSFVPVPSTVIQVGFLNGERQLWPPPCTDCCAARLAHLDRSGESFVNGSLKLTFHIKKSRKNFYDATSELSSSAVQHLHLGDLPGAAAAGQSGKRHADLIADGIHYYTTLGQLRMYISAHLRERHGYVVPPEVLQITRGKNRPLKRRSSPPPSSLSSAAAPGEACKRADGSLAEDAEWDSLTLQELGIRDGESLAVQSADIIAQVCATTATNEEWEVIPPELLQAGPRGGAPTATAFKEHTAAFRETRLQGSQGKAPRAAAPGTTAQAATAASLAAATTIRGGVTPGSSGEQGIACHICTFLNAPGMVVCEMCEAPLPRA